MLTDLYKFLTSESTADLDADRADAISTIRSTIGNAGTSPMTMRMFPDILDIGVALPALSYVLIDNRTDHLLEGPSSGLIYPRIQIDCWAQSRIAADNLADAVKTALDGLTDFLVNTKLCVLIWDNQINEFEPERKQYRTMLDFLAYHN